MTLRMTTAGLALCAALICAGPALAQTACAPPKAPDPLTAAKLGKPSLPEKPACAANNRCRDADVNSYNTAIGRYNSELFEYQQARNRQQAEVDAYIAKLNLFAANTQNYLACEQKRLIDILN